MKLWLASKRVLDQESVLALARELLETAGVAITPGKDFGEHGATRHVRFAYTRSQEEIAEGIERMRRALAGGA